MATLPLVAARPRITATQSGAVANRNGTGTIYKLFQGNTQSGSRVERITAFNMGLEGDVVNTYMCRLYITDANGNNPRLFREQTIPGYTVQETSAIAAPPSQWVQFTFPSGLVMGTNSCIYVGQSFAGGATPQITHWICEAADFQ